MNILSSYVIGPELLSVQRVIYRVYHIQRLIELFTTKKNALRWPHKWDDPFENFKFKRRIQIAESKHKTAPETDGFYGQCWSLEKESDAMWRIYSPEKNGVKVKTTAGKLIKSLALATEGQGSCYLGKVSYLPDADIREKLNNISPRYSKDTDPLNQAESLLLKREEFKHEQEVRLLFCSDRPTNQEFFKYPIVPNDIFYEIEFDPRLPDELFKVYKHYFKEKIKFTGPIQKSKLYQLPDYNPRLSNNDLPQPAALTQ